jgi:Ni/Co efflux regulator RcnB
VTARLPRAVLAHLHAAIEGSSMSLAQSDRAMRETKRLLADARRTIARARSWRDHREDCPCCADY